MTLALRVIECDNFNPVMAHVEPRYGQMFETAFQRVRSDWSYEYFKAHEGELPSFDSAYGYLITGSKADAFSDEPWTENLRAWVREAAAKGLAIVGVCFGHQLLAHALGGKAARHNGGWGIGRMPVQSQSADVPDGQLLAIHQDQVVELPADASRVMSSAFCPNYSFTLNSVLGIQGHPEFLPSYIELLGEARRDRIGEDRLQEALDSLASSGNEDEVLEWLATHLERHVA